jgi:hypothetical protein
MATDEALELLAKQTRSTAIQHVASIWQVLSELETERDALRGHDDTGADAKEGMSTFLSMSGSSPGAKS